MSSRDEARRAIIERLLGKRTWESLDLLYVLTVEEVAARLTADDMYALVPGPTSAAPRDDLLAAADAVLQSPERLVSSGETRHVISKAAIEQLRRAVGDALRAPRSPEP